MISSCKSFWVTLIGLIGCVFIWLCAHCYYVRSQKNDFLKLLMEVSKSLIIACGTFLLINIYTYSLNESNFNLNKANDPLILANEPNMELKGSKGRIKLSIRQGTVTKGVLVLFKDSNKVTYIPVNFKNRQQVLMSGYFNLSRYMDLNIKNIHYSKKDARIKSAAGKIKQNNILRLGMVLKDSAGNVQAYYYIIRPQAQSNATVVVKQSSEELTKQYNAPDTFKKEYTYKQVCKNKSKNYIISNQIIGSNSIESDIDSVLNSFYEHNSEFTHYKFFLANKHESKIQPSQFKAVKGHGTLQDVFDQIKPKEDVIMNLRPFVYLHYQLPDRDQVNHDLIVLDNIIKDYKKS